MIVEVVWHDAFSQTTGWDHARVIARRADEPLEVHSVGHLLERSKRHIVLAMNRHGERAADTMTIPLGCVRKVRRLTAGR